MSFSLTAVGTVDQVRAQIAAVKARDNETIDHTQRDRVLDLVEAELTQWPACADPSMILGLSLEASGHHDAYNSNLSLTIRPVWFPRV